MDRVGKDLKKPKDKMSAYAFFMQATREEQKKNSGESRSFLDFSKKASERWKNLSVEDRKTYKEMAANDSVRYKKEMANYVSLMATTKENEKPKISTHQKRHCLHLSVFQMKNVKKFKLIF
ncbi:hypothetical protein HELRODRAFT_91764 [Helobdella robusta]|uniref:HMG box domain-containing protein n=1 Tax=Helobdella robusta TaxID=6412 RepID=T1G885_HELRO|nr:hypothetical protein HELRODRAFT_91764 [Helobdella robusta]ESO10510.1 hypothetical protein HELRODRAFT_91764 [Helobdella robusta]